MGPREYAIIAAIAFVVIFLLIGYAVKKRIPSQNRLNPQIVLQDLSTKCSMHVSTASRLLPFVAEKAHIHNHKEQFRCDIHNLHIQAVDRNSFRILNAEKLPKKGVSICHEKYTVAEYGRLEACIFTYRDFSMSAIPEPGEMAGQFFFGYRK